MEQKSESTWTKRERPHSLPARFDKSRSWKLNPPGEKAEEHVVNHVSDHRHLLPVTVGMNKFETIPVFRQPDTYISNYGPPRYQLKHKENDTCLTYIKQP